MSSDLLPVPERGSQTAGQLIWTAGALTAAVYAAQSFDDVLGLHALYERDYALEIAVAAAGDGNVGDDAVLDVKFHKA